MTPINKHTLKNSLLTAGFLILALLAFTTIVKPSSTYASTIQVNSKADTAADDGECTLREAIDSANGNVVSGGTTNECVAGDASPTTDTIEFNISGTADFTRQGQDGYKIALQSALSSLAETVIIDGYSQPNALYNTDPNQTRILIEIDGAATTAASAFYIDSPNSTVRGLSVYDFEYSCIGTSDLADNATIEGNYVGISGDNQTVLGSANEGITLGQSGGSENSTIVSNLISGVTYNGITINGVSNSSIENNIISDGDSGGISFGINSPSDEVDVVGNIVSNNADGGIFVTTGGVPAVINVYSNTVLNNGTGGIGVFAASGVRIGAPGLGNTVYGHSQGNIGVTSLTGFFGAVSNVTIQSNT
ncbi:right-handed parallel beta-helix repeat-containing protein, partial [Candidatus Saccharibacteria bacterium]|nr:right-handed parallel beta-helix repeat-containing protein [Candidatus Saccharibacteria bacterium]